MFGVNGAREKFLIIEELNGTYEITQACRDFKKKRISAIRNSFVKDINKLRRPIGGTDKIIFLLNSASATTAESAVTITRPRPEEIINENEADQLVYQAFWDFMNRYRGMAVKKMNANDLDLIATNIQVREVALGENKIFNPVGFKGREITFRVRGTLIPRKLLPALERFKKWGRVFVFEKTGILPGALSEFAALRAGPGFSFQVSEDQAAVFRVDKDEQYPVGKIGWGTDSLISGIISELNVDKETAQAILCLYFKNDISDRVKRWMDAKVTESFNVLGKLLYKLEEKQKSGHAAFYFDFQLPESVPPKWLKRLRGESVRIDEELGRREFVLRGLFSEPSRFNILSHQNALSALSLDYDLSKLDFINQLLRRRVRWLIPNF